jgi:hypothetical protein
MLDDLEDKVLGRPQQFSIKDLLRDGGLKADQKEATNLDAEEQTDTLPPLDEMSPLPKPGDPYKAFSRPQMKPAATLHCLRSDGSIRGFAWANYDGIDFLPAEEPGQGPVLVLRFAGIFSREVAITGRHLDLLHNYLSHQRVSWVRELPPGKILKEDGSAVITGMQIRHVEQER